MRNSQLVYEAVLPAAGIPLTIRNNKNKQMKFLKLLPAFLLVAGFISCQQSGEQLLVENCDKGLIVNENLYNNPQSSAFTITNAVLQNNCLELTITASGCDGETWVTNLITSGGIADSNPQQAFLKLSFTNKEVCTAVVTQKVSFDISALTTSAVKKLVLNLAGWNKPLVYEQ